jgi:arsenate reductase
MAEGWARHLWPSSIDVRSAGVKPGVLDARAVRVMAEAGIDISNQRAKHVDEIADLRFDLVVTVCDHARESCPVFPGARQTVHESFDDPPLLAANARSEEEALSHYRRVRDEIRAFVETIPETSLQKD